MLSILPIVCLVANLAFGNAAVIPQKRDLIDDIENTILAVLGVLAGTNSDASGSDAWLGTDGTYTGEFINNSGKNLTLVLWGSAGSWVNVDKPLITYELANAATLDVSFADGASGAFAAIVDGIELVNGQVANTWGEFTFSGDYSTFDVSREVNMDGGDLAIETEGCISDMTTCVFQCTGGATSCWETYELSNCATGSQQGAEYGEYYGAPSGGCLVGSNKHIKATFS